MTGKGDGQTGRLGGDMRDLQRCARDAHPP